jgi:phosphotriesterase-related protein
VVGFKDRGVLDHILIGQDMMCKPMLLKYGGFGYSIIINKFLPLLRERGITEENIETLLVKNPSNALRMRET